MESVQALAKEFGDFSHDVQHAWSSLNSFGGDATALSWVGQSADAFKASFGPLPGRLQKLYISYGEASDALSAYWPKLQAAQNKADAALRQGQDAEADVSRATGTADNAAADLKTAQAGADPKATADAQTAHDNAQKALSDAKGRLATLAAQAHQAHDDLQAAAKDCAKALHHAQSDGIHNKHWWQHVGEVLSEVGGKIAEWSGEIGQIAAVLAPILNGIAVLTVEVPGLDVVTAGLAAADDLIAETAPEVSAAGMAIEASGDSLQGHWAAALTNAVGAASFRFGPRGGTGESAGEENPGDLANDTPGVSNIRDPRGRYSSNGEPRTHTRNSEYPHSYSAQTHETMQQRWTVEGQEQGTPWPVDEHGNRLAREDMTWIDDDGQIIPYEDLSYDHKPDIVEHWNTIGYDSDRTVRVDYYDNPDNMTAMRKSGPGGNSSLGATNGMTYRQDTGDNYKFGRNEQ